MDPIYPRFAQADPVFYDDPRRRVRPKSNRFAPDPSLDWADWLSADDGHWASWHPRGGHLPAQGWKIHVSATRENARGILANVSSYCHRHRDSFKHLSHPEVLDATSSKEADRSASGKFITIYSRDEDDLHDTLRTLDELVGGLPGPYVLTDLRWNAGPVFVRYGAFFREFVDIDGVRVPALRQPDGTLAEDVRSPSFFVPEWVSVPSFLKAQLASLGGLEAPKGFPEVTRALHHSNAGGVYDAIDSDGAAIVLKEARAHVGLTPDGRDAAKRLLDEAATLADLGHAASVVRMRRVFESHSHRFLVMDRIDGRSLNDLVVELHPLIRADATRAARRDYRDWALTVAEQLTAAVRTVHAAGYSHGDLHPGNALVTSDNKVVLIDFEMSRPLTEAVPAIIGAPGFTPPDRRGGRELDLYALACIRLFLFAPLTPLLGADSHKATDLAQWAVDQFDLSDGWCHDLLGELGVESKRGEFQARAGTLPTQPKQREYTVSETIELVAEALLEDATFDRPDRAWPGDPAQFNEPRAAVAHGAGGVLVSLHTAGIAIPEPGRQWFESAVGEMLDSDTPPLGLLDGLAGVAWAQRALGHHAQAQRTIERLRNTDLRGFGPGLYGGTAGIGLFLLAEAEGDAALLALVRTLADDLHEQLLRQAPRLRDTAATGRAGLLRGWSGAALFASRLFQVTGASEHLQLAELALDEDLAACAWALDGSFQMNEGWRLMPYFGSGSAGVGIALAELIPHSARRDEYERALVGIERAMTPELVMYPGLMQGRAGLIHSLVRLAQAGQASTRGQQAIAQHVRLLRLHAIRRPHGIGFPGHGLLRLSCDLATGAAGVLSALVAYEHHLSGDPARGSAMPFFDRPQEPKSNQVTSDLSQFVKGGDSLGLSAFPAVPRPA